jgi:hypothetical protein
MGRSLSREDGSIVSQTDTGLQKTYHVIATHCCCVTSPHMRKLHEPTGNIYHVTATYCCVTSPRIRLLRGREKTQLPLLFRARTSGVTER